MSWPAPAMPEATATVLAVVEDKAAHPGLLTTARTTRFPIEIVTAEAMRAADARIATRSERVLRQRGVGSVCEAAALAAAGPNARLLVTRQVVGRPQCHRCRRLRGGSGR